MKRAGYRSQDIKGRILSSLNEIPSKPSTCSAFSESPRFSPKLTLFWSEAEAVRPTMHWTPRPNGCGWLSAELGNPGRGRWARCARSTEGFDSLLTARLLRATGQGSFLTT